MNNYTETILYRMYRNAILMMRDRGYGINNIITSLDVFVRKYISGRATHINIYADDGTYMAHIAQNKNKFRKQDEFKPMMASIVDGKKRLKNLDIFVGPKVTKVILKHCTSDIYNLTFNRSTLLLIDRPRHILIPHHILHKETTIKKKEIGGIFLDDPMVIWYGAKLGDVFEIRREYKDSIFDLTNFTETLTNTTETVFREVRRRTIRKKETPSSKTSKKK